MPSVLCINDECAKHTVIVANVVGTATFPLRHEQALDSFLYFIEHAVAKAGRSLVTVTAAVVYVAQNATAEAELAVNAAAQASFALLSHARMTKGAKTPRMMEERIMTSI